MQTKLTQSKIHRATETTEQHNEPSNTEFSSLSNDALQHCGCSTQLGCEGKLNHTKRVWESNRVRVGRENLCNHVVEKHDCCCIPTTNQCNKKAHIFQCKWGNEIFISLYSVNVSQDSWESTEYIFLLSPFIR